MECRCGRKLQANDIFCPWCGLATREPPIPRQRVQGSASCTYVLLVVAAAIAGAFLGFTFCHGHDHPNPTWPAQQSAQPPVLPNLTAEPAANSSANAAAATLRAEEARIEVLRRFRAPAATRRFLAHLTTDMERLNVDYTNASHFEGSGMRDRADERRHWLLGLRPFPVAELAAPRDEGAIASSGDESAPEASGTAHCPSERYLIIDSSLLLGGGRMLAWLASKVACDPLRRALLIAMRTAPPAAGHRALLSQRLLPLLQGWNYSFDPISTRCYAPATEPARPVRPSPCSP